MADAITTTARGSATAVSTDDASSEADWLWRYVEVPAADAFGAVAVDASGSRVALGDEDGVSLRSVGGEGDPVLQGSGWRRIGLPGPVTDLAFAPDGAVWAATARGLFRVEPNGRRREHSPGPGEDARRVHRVTTVGNSVISATDGGLFVSADGRAWTRIVDGFPLAPVIAVAARSVERVSGDPDAFEVFAIADTQLWRLTLQIDGGVVEPGLARAIEIPGQPADQSAIDVRTGVAGDAIVVLFTQAIARTLDVGSGRGARWEVVYPVFAPGAIALRLFDVAGSIWLATDQGLMVPLHWPTRWQRAGSPAGHTPIVAVSGTRDAVYAVGPRTLLRGQPVPKRSGPKHPEAVRVVPPDPDLRRVHAKALEQAGLEPGYFAGLRTRLGRRGWVPAISLRAGAAYDVDNQGDYDESFTYGQLQRLNDRFDGRSTDIEGSVTFTWDLADVVYDPDAPDLSREARQVITLRDNVLDEINQLYFDRRRALLALADYADRSDPEAVALEIRCEELAAGLDAWTGGWFSQQLEVRR